MDRPVHDIGSVIAALCTGTAAEQEAALHEHFTPDAYFVHPFCAVPSFGDTDIPLFGTINSRWLIKYVYLWYRFLSPHIEIHIDSKVFDQQHRLLYLTMRQVFTIWFVPFSLWQAHVRLVTVLKLEVLPAGNGPAGLDTNGVANDRTVVNKYYIRGQEDFYQVNEWLKFIAPWGAHLLWTAWQLFATFLCWAGIILLWPVVSAVGLLFGNKGRTHAAKAQ